MPTTTLQSGQSATVFLSEGESVTVTPSGTTQVSAADLNGGYLVSQTINAATQYGPYTAAARVAVGVLAGTATVADGPGRAIAVSASRNLTNADNGQTLECTTTLTLTMPVGLVSDFACAIIPSGTTSIASDGTALLNGATTTLTRAAASNAMVAIQARISAANSYVVTGS